MTAPVTIPQKPDYQYDPQLAGKIAASLKESYIWVIWRYVWNPKAKDGKGNWDKRPYSAIDDKPSGWTNRARHVSFDQAYSAQATFGADGVGIVLAADEDLIGVDLDKCLDEAWAEQIVSNAETYCEFSPSGQGYRLIARGHAETDLRAKPFGIELYGGGRFLTITGNMVPGSPATVNEAPATLEEVKRQIELACPTKPAPKRGQPKVGTNPFFRAVNEAALKDIGAWMPEIFGDQAQYQDGTKAYRVSAEDLGRDLQEDLSVHPKGINDFGLETTKTALDVVIEHGGAPDAMRAALWLCETLNVDPATLGYKPNHKEPSGEPLPLYPEPQAAQPYPMHALGPLADAALAIQRKVQAPDALAAQSVLAVASLCVQGFADIRTPAGQTGPTSLHFITVAASGDRKSSCDSQALKGVWTHERDLKFQYDDDIEAFKRRHAIYTALYRKIVNDKKLTVDDQNLKLLELGKEPERPLSPFKVATDTTLEGLVKQWVDGHPSLGLFSAEGGMFTGGHGMKSENKLNTAGQLSALWDGAPVKRLRAGDGLIQLFGRRLSMHLMLQPNAAQAFFSDPVLRDQGLLSRPLVAYPSSLAGHRPFAKPSAADEITITQFQNDILSILRAPLPLDEDTRNELMPREIALSNEAEILWIEFYNGVEAQQKEDEAFRPICDFASKAGEHAARIAAVLELFNDTQAEEISASAMADAIELANWYLHETLRLHEAGHTSPDLTAAQKLLDWIKSGNENFTVRQAQQKGPRALRLKKPLEQAIVTLLEHGQIKETQKKPLTYSLVV